MKSLRIPGIIHLFALLHAVVTLACRMTGYEDSLLLTILTMSMAVIICIKLGLKVEFIAATVIVVNVAGYLLGTIGGELIGQVIHNPCFIHSLATLLTTEILGWGIVGSVKVFRHGLAERPIGILHYPRLRWLIIIFIVIYHGGKFNVINIKIVIICRFLSFFLETFQFLSKLINKLLTFFRYRRILGRSLQLR